MRLIAQRAASAPSWRRAAWSVRLMTVACGLSMVGLSGQALPVWGQPTSPPPPAHTQALAQGFAAFRRGDLAGATVQWQAAARLATAAEQPQAASLALTHLARAYEGLGVPERAAESLRTALPLAAAAGDRAQQALILGSQGQLALAQHTGPATTPPAVTTALPGTRELVGAPSDPIAEAERLVQEALTVAHDLPDAGLRAFLLHTRGNVGLAQAQPAQALALYRASAAAAQQAQQPGMQARALAHAARAAERLEQPQTALALLDEAMPLLRQAEPSHDTATTLLGIGRAYHRLAATTPALRRQAAVAFTQAADLAQPLRDTRTLSYAWGYVGRLYEDEQRYEEALQLTRRASLAVQHGQAPEVLYLWQWQSGRLLWAVGDLPAAQAAYERALVTLQELRPEVLRGAGRGAPSFRATVGPLYFELADLLLRRAAALEGSPHEPRPPAYSQYLRQARDTIEQFKTAELREYFGDECVAAVPPRRTALDHVAPDTAILYPILLPDRTELLVSLPTGLQRLSLPVTGATLEQRVRLWRAAVHDQAPVRYLPHAQALYGWLVRPLDTALAAQQIRTLVLVPDGALRLLPLAALHDGERFLIEKYAVAVTPSLTLTEPRPLPQDKVQVLAAGLTGSIEGSAPLPHVAEELTALEHLYGSTVLRDAAFTPARLDTALRQGDFGVVHLATHGHFAAEATQSFLLTAQGKLTLPQLAQMLGRLRFRAQPIELLTLSACDTAAGDDRAALGLAGVALQAGARSALATLWPVADDAAAVGMAAFYRHLQVPGTSRARALQQAQQGLLQDPRYAEPVFWAPFVLLNNWL